MSHASDQGALFGAGPRALRLRLRADSHEEDAWPDGRCTDERPHRLSFTLSLEQLRAAVRAALRRGTNQEAGTLLADPAVLGLLLSNRLGPLLASTIRRGDGAAVLPPALTDDARLAATRALAAASTVRDVAAALDRAGVGWMLWKGPALAALAWDDFSLRHFTDLDLVVRPEDREAAAAALLGAGWRRRSGMTRAQQRAIQAGAAAYDFERGDAESLIELHWRFAARRFPSPVAVDDAFARGETVEVAGVGLRTPSGRDALELHAMHATKHGWSLAEEVVVFARLIDRWPDAASALRTESLGGQGVGALALGFALAEFLVTGEQREAKGPLASAVSACVDRMLRGDAAWRPDHDWALHWIDRPGDRARYWMHALLDPTAEEWKWVRLPGWLCWSYPAVRIARLLNRRPPSAV